MDCHSVRNGQASIHTPNLITPNSSASSSTRITPSIPDASSAASSSTYAPQGTAPQYENLEFGTVAERESASRPKKDRGKQKQRLEAVKASQRQAQQQPHSQPEVPADQPHPQPQYAPGFQPYSQPQYVPGPQPQLQPQAQPPHLPVHPSLMYQFPNPNVAPGPAPNANYGWSNAGFGAGWSQNGTPGVQGMARTIGPPSPFPSSYFPQPQMGQWPSGHVVPASHHYGGYTPGPQAMGAPFYTSPVPTVPGPAIGVNHQAMVLPPQEQEQATAAPATSWMRWNIPRRPEDINPWLASISPPPPSPSGGPSQIPSHYDGEQSQGLMPPAASVAADEGSLVQGRKRRLTDDDDTRQTKRNRLSVGDDPDFEIVIKANGEKKWRCTKPACSKTKALKEVSIDQHRLTATHRKGSSEPQPEFKCPHCGETFLRFDSLKRHGPTERCSTNKKSEHQVLQNRKIAPAPPVTAQGPSPGAASSSATEQFQLSPVFHQEVPYLPVVQSSVQASSVPRSMERQPSGAAPLPVIAATNLQTFHISPPLPEPRSVQQQIFWSPSSPVMAEDIEGLFMPPTPLPLPLPTAHAMDAPVPDEDAVEPPIFSFNYAVLDTDFEDWCLNATEKR